jgi:tRNA-dihydrouridine synthase 2
VAKLVEKDVAAIDVNMGCPKSFSVAGGMGVALAANMENAKKILTALVAAVSIPVTCKIRIRKTTEETIEHVKELASTGISAIGIHARTKDERPQHSPHPEVIKAVVEAGIGIPVICNGGSREISKYKDIQIYKDLCGCSSIMIARAAEWNPSIFKPTGLIDKMEIIKMYLRYAVRFGNTLPNTKFNIQNILLDLQDTEMGKEFLATESMEQICKVFGMENYFRKKDEKLMQRHFEILQGEHKIPDTNGRKQYFGLTSEPIRENVKFIRANYSKDADLPKSIFHLYARKNVGKVPTYDYDRKGSNFRAVFCYNKKLYGSSLYEKNKRNAEQSACLAACLQFNLIDREECIKNGSLNPIEK